MPSAVMQDKPLPSLHTRYPSEVQKAIQFDKATTGIPISVMRDQIISNTEVLFSPNTHSENARYITVVGTVSSQAAPIPFYQAAVIRVTVDDGSAPVMQSDAEATIYAAYRNLFRMSMDEIGKALRAVDKRKGREEGKMETKGHVKKGSCESEKGLKSLRVLGLDQ